MNNYHVYRIFEDNHDKEILYTDLTRDEAMKVVQNSPDERGSMVNWCKQS